MKIIEEAQKRKDELEIELKLINQLLAFHAEAAIEGVDPQMSLSEAVRAKIISVRMCNAIVMDKQWFGEDATTKTITLADVKARAAEMSDPEILMVPNFGRKSLNELKDLLRRMP